MHTFLELDFKQGPNLGLTVLGVDQVGLEGEFVLDGGAARIVASAHAALVLELIRTQHQVATDGLKFLSSLHHVSLEESPTDTKNEPL
jgi:hypothetical protein